MTITQWFLLILSVHSLYLMIVLQLFLLGEVKQETIDMMSGGELCNSLFILYVTEVKNSTEVLLVLGQ